MTDTIRVMWVAAPYNLQKYRSITRYFPSDMSVQVVSGALAFNGKIPLLGKMRGDRHWFMPNTALFRELRRFQPDIVFTDFPTYPGLYAKMYSYLSAKRKPLVSWLLGDFWTEYDVYVREVKLRDRWQATVSLVTWVTGIKRSDRLLTVCRWLMRRAAEVIPQTKMSVLYNGIEPDLWLVNDGRFEFDHPAVGILQNNVIKPKVMGLLRFSEVIQTMPDVNFYVAGGGPYTQLVRDAFHGLTNVRMLGTLAYPNEVRRFYRSCDVYVLASGLDCCPSSLLEASLASVPVVASRVGGIPELVKEGETGWTIPNASVDDWTRKIRTLLEDRGLATRMGAHGKEHVLRNFTWRRQAQMLANVFETLIR